MPVKLVFLAMIARYDAVAGTAWTNRAGIAPKAILTLKPIRRLRQIALWVAP